MQARTESSPRLVTCKECGKKIVRRPGDVEVCCDCYPFGVGA